MGLSMWGCQGEVGKVELSSRGCQGGVAKVGFQARVLRAAAVKSWLLLLALP